MPHPRQEQPNPNRRGFPAVCPACEGDVWERCEYCDSKGRVTTERAEIIRLQVASKHTDKIE